MVKQLPFSTAGATVIQNGEAVCLLILYISKEELAGVFITVFTHLELVLHCINVSYKKSMIPSSFFSSIAASLPWLNIKLICCRMQSQAVELDEMIEIVNRERKYHQVYISFATTDQFL